MPHVVRAFPLRGSVADLQAFAQALAGPRAVDAGRFYRHYGVEREDRETGGAAAGEEQGGD